MSDRPFSPPGAEIMAQAFDAYSAWEYRWGDDLEGVESIIERATIYSYMSDGIDIDLAKTMARMDCERLL